MARFRQLSASGKFSREKPDHSEEIPSVRVTRLATENLAKDPLRLLETTGLLMGQPSMPDRGWWYWVPKSAYSPFHFIVLGKTRLLKPSRGSEATSFGTRSRERRRGGANPVSAVPQL